MRYKPCGAENCQLTKDKERIAELEGQLEQMRESTNYVAQLEAERDRLREALLLISSSKRESPSYCLDPKVGLAKARGIARKALEAKP